LDERFARWRSRRRDVQVVALLLLLPPPPPLLAVDVF
jgi:hypothetical protein